MAAIQAATCTPSVYGVVAHGDWERRFSVSAFGPADTWKWTGRVTNHPPFMHFSNQAHDPPQEDSTVLETDSETDSMLDQVDPPNTKPVSDLMWCYTCECHALCTSAQPWSRSLTGWVCPPCAAMVQNAYTRVACGSDDVAWTAIAAELVAHNRHFKWLLRN